jgi:hypothetical protein
MAGDVMLYQSRGGPIRECIRACVADATRPVVLLGHSLGGIACVDLLAAAASDGAPRVDLLVTAGSQAPFLYEIGALASLGPDDPLPDHFPTWLNVYDPRDILSYVAGPVFRPPGSNAQLVSDVAVDNRQPFPMSHSAYWCNSEFWDAVAPPIRALST